MCALAQGGVARLPGVSNNVVNRVQQPLHRKTDRPNRNHRRRVRFAPSAADRTYAVIRAARGRRDHGLQGDRRKGIIVRVVTGQVVSNLLCGLQVCVCANIRARIIIDILLLLFPIEPTGDVFHENPRGKNNR